MAESYTLVHRHKILLCLMTVKNIFFILLVLLIIWVSFSYKYILNSDVSNYIFLPLIIVSINYLFLRIILHGIDFYGKIVLIGGPSIVICHTSFLLIDDIEFIDIKSILKLDVERHGLLANILNYGHLIIEQRNDERRIHYIPFPYQVYDLIKKHIPKIEAPKV